MFGIVSRILYIPCDRSAARWRRPCKVVLFSSSLVKQSLAAFSSISIRVYIVPKSLEFEPSRSIFTLIMYKTVVTD